MQSLIQKKEHFFSRSSIEPIADKIKKKESCTQIVQSRLDRRLQEIERDLKRDKDQQQQQDEVRTLINELQYQRKLTTPVHNEEDKIYQARLLLAESNKQLVKSQFDLFRLFKSI